MAVVARQRCWFPTPQEGGQAFPASLRAFRFPGLDRVAAVTAEQRVKKEGQVSSYLAPSSEHHLLPMVGQTFNHHRGVSQNGLIPAETDASANHAVRVASANVSGSTAFANLLAERNPQPPKTYTELLPSLAEEAPYQSGPGLSEEFRADLLWFSEYDYPKEWDSYMTWVPLITGIAQSSTWSEVWRLVAVHYKDDWKYFIGWMKAVARWASTPQINFDFSELKGLVSFSTSSEFSIVFAIITFVVTKVLVPVGLLTEETLDWLKEFTFDSSDVLSCMNSAIGLVESAISGRLSTLFADRSFSGFLSGAAAEANSARQYILHSAARTDILGMRFSKGANMLPIKEYREGLERHKQTLTKRLNGKDAVAVVSALKEVNMEISRVRQNQVTRYTPFCVGVVGPPGIGKTSIVRAITKSLLTFWDVPGTLAENVIAIDEKAKHVEHYAQQTVTFFDDVGPPNRRDKECVMDLFLRLASADPAIIPGAAIENKANFFTSSFITMTSNFEKMGYDERMANYLAALRRIVRIRVSLKEEYNDGDRLDGHDGSGDYWNFEIIYGKDGASSKMMHSLNELNTYLSYLSVVHFHNQSVMRDYETVNLCNCGVPTSSVASNLPGPKCVEGAHREDSKISAATTYKPLGYTSLDDTIKLLDELQEEMARLYGSDPQEDEMPVQTEAQLMPYSFLADMWRVNFFAFISQFYFYGIGYFLLYASGVLDDIKSGYSRVERLFRKAESVTVAEVTEVALAAINPLTYARSLDPRTALNRPLSWAYARRKGILMTGFSVALLHVLRIALKGWREAKSRHQVSDSDDPIPVSVSQEPPPSYSTKGLPVPSFSRGITRTFGRSDLLKFVSQEMYRVEVEEANGRFIGAGFSFSLSCADVLVPKHYFAGDGPWYLKFEQPWRQGNFCVRHCVQPEELNTDDSADDYCTIKVFIGGAQGLSRFLQKGRGFDFRAMTDLVALDAARSSVSNLKPFNPSFVKVATYDREPMIVYTGLWGPGMCGTPLFGKFGKDWVLVGFHSRGTIDGKEGLATIMPDVSFPDSTHPFQINPLSRRSFLHHLGEKTETPVQVLGSIGNHIPRPTTQFVESGLATPDIELEPPNFTPHEHEGKWAFGPLYNLTRRQSGMNRSIVREMTVLLNHQLELLGETCVPKYAPYTVHEAINGKGKLGPMDMSTSGGINFPGPKGQYFTRDLTDSGAVWYPTPPIQKAVDAILDKYRGGNHARPVFTTFLKDELVKPSKNVEGRHRLIYCSQVEWTIVVRMYLGPLFSFMHENPLVFGIAVGMNPLSEDWASILEFLRQVDPDLKFLTAGDYSGFDVNLLQTFVYGFGLYCCRWLTRMGAPPDAVYVCNLIFEDLACHICTYGGDVYAPNGGNPSGWPGTIFLNSMVNQSFHIGTICEKLVAGVPFRGMRMVTMGDDVVATSPGALDQIAHSNMGEYYHYKYTTADKKDVEKPYTGRHELTFLKRRFEERDGLVWAPLDEGSIWKSVKYCRSSKALSKEESIQTNCRNALVEAFVHGREFHDVVFSVAGESAGAGYDFDSLSEDFKEGDLFSKWVKSL